MDAIEAEFGKRKTLYDVLEVKPTASESEIKKAYFKVALKCHPDKCPGDKAANGRFQVLSMVHAVLQDPERRRLYDECGEIAEDGNEGGVEEGDIWFDYWRTLFPKVTVADIESFSGKYKGSQEEKQDVLEAYKQEKGNMINVMDRVLLATAADEERFRHIVELAIECKEVSAFAAFRAGADKNSRGATKKAAKRRAKAEKEAAEAEELMAKIKGRHTGQVAAGSLATHRSKQFESMVSSIEARYGDANGSGSSRTQKKTKRGGKSESPAELDDAEFERIQKQLLKKSKG